MWSLLLGLLACTGSSTDDSAATTDDTPRSPFVTLVSDRAEAVLSVRGTSATDVWAVGADAGLGDGPLVLHYDGTGWTELETGTSGSLWSVQPTETGATMVGADGVILDYNSASGTFTQQPGPTGITLLGVWGAHGNDLWAAGGDLVRIENPAVWRNVGGTWAQYVDDTTKLFGHKTYLTGVSGAAADDLWLIGTQEILAHFDGQGLTLVERGNKNDLASVCNTGAFAVSVGGLQSAYILHEEEDGDWDSHSPALQPQLKAVDASLDQMVAVGSRGVVLRYVGSEWVPDPVAVNYYDLTAVWLDPDGGVWIGGGDLSAQPESRGYLGYQGSANVAGG